MGTHGARAAVRAPGIALMRIGVGIVLHLIIPGLHMVGWRAVPTGKGGEGRQKIKKEAQRQPDTSKQVDTGPHWDEIQHGLLLCVC